MNGYRLRYEDFLFDEFELIRDIWFESFIDDVLQTHNMNSFEKHFKNIELACKSRAIHKNDLSIATILSLIKEN